MRPWGLPPKYGIYPISLLERTDVPAHLKLTYLTLYALAWRTKHEAVLQSMAQLADLFSQLEGRSLTERGMRNRMTQLGKLGLVKRIFANGRWLTHLLLKHEGEPSSTGATSASVALQSATSIIVNDNAEITLPNQHQSSICGTGSATLASTGDSQTDAIRSELWAMGIDEPTATDLALMEHISLEYIDDWAAYLGYHAAIGESTKGTGWLILQMKAGRRAPITISGRTDKR